MIHFTKALCAGNGCSLWLARGKGITLALFGLAHQRHHTTLRLLASSCDRERGIASEVRLAKGSDKPTEHNNMTLKGR